MVQEFTQIVFAAPVVAIASLRHFFKIDCLSHKFRTVSSKKFKYTFNPFVSPFSMSHINSIVQIRTGKNNMALIDM